MWQRRTGHTCIRSLHLAIEMYTNIEGANRMHTDLKMMAPTVNDRIWITMRWTHSARFRW